MSLTAKEGDSKPKQQPPAGTHVARCYSVIDLGTQENPFGASRPRIRLWWELPEETAVFSEDKGEQPFVVSKEYTLSLFDKANLRHDLESWRGREFTEEERKGFDVSTLVGVPCMLTVVHKTSGEKVYANVAGVGKLTKGVTCPAQVNPSVVYLIDEGRSEVFKSLPEWLRKKIESSEEFQGDKHQVEEEELSDDDGSIPF